MDELVEEILYEAECWCSLNNVNILDLDDADFEQCIINTASALSLDEETVEYTLNKYLK